MRPGARRTARKEPAWRVGAPPRSRQGATGGRCASPIAAARQPAWSKPRRKRAAVGRNGDERGRRGEQARRSAGDDLGGHRVGDAKGAAELQRVHEGRAPGPRRRPAPTPPPRAEPGDGSAPARRRQAAAPAARPAQEAQDGAAGPARRAARRDRRAASPARRWGEDATHPPPPTPRRGRRASGGGGEHPSMVACRGVTALPRDCNNPAQWLRTLRGRSTPVPWRWWAWPRRLRAALAPRARAVAAMSLTLARRINLVPGHEEPIRGDIHLLPRGSSIVRDAVAASSTNTTCLPSTGEKVRQRGDCVRSPCERRQADSQCASRRSETSRL